MYEARSNFSPVCEVHRKSAWSNSPSLGRVPRRERGNSRLGDSEDIGKGTHLTHPVIGIPRYAYLGHVNASRRCSSEMSSCPAITVSEQAPAGRARPKCGTFASGPVVAVLIVLALAYPRVG